MPSGEQLVTVSATDDAVLTECIQRFGTGVSVYGKWYLFGEDEGTLLERLSPRG